MSEARGLPQPGDRLDRYEVLTRLAYGGMAAVYAVRRTSIGGFDKLLAMKVILPHLCEDRRVVDMFLDEGRIAARIQHPNVLQVFDVAEDAGLPYIIMEYVAGQSLARVVKRAQSRGERLPIGVVVGVLTEVAEGLHGAHLTRGADGQLLRVIHRDVSPQNVMVSYDGDVKVVDFGIASARGRIASTHSGELKGKLGYVAPEAIDKSRSLDHRADLWALGVMGWELLAGERLFRDDDDATTLWNVMSREIPRLDRLRPDLPAALVEGVAACLQRDVDQRLDSAMDLAEKLRPLMHEFGGHRADRSQLLRSLFADDELRAKEQLVTPGSSSTSSSAAGTDAAEPTDVTSHSEVSAGVVPRRSFAALLGVVTFGVVAVIGGTGLRRRAESATTLERFVGGLTWPEFPTAASSGQAASTNTAPEAASSAPVATGTTQRVVRPPSTSRPTRGKLPKPSGRFDNPY